MRHKFWITLIAGFSLGAASLPGHALAEESLRGKIENMLKTHQRMIAAEADVKSSSETMEASKEGWYPALSFSANMGNEKINNPGSTADTSLASRVIDASITQNVYDFGATSSLVKSANLTVEKSVATRSATRQALIMEGIAAHLNVIRAVKLLKFSKNSVANIKKQLELEDARVKRGSGLSTDVLQAKKQLAGADARMIQARGVLRSSLNRYRAIFGHTPADNSALMAPRLPLGLLPATIDEAVQETFTHNPQLIAASLDADLASEAVTTSKVGAYYPSIDLVYNRLYKEDDAGTRGTKHEQTIKIEISKDFNLGMTAINTLNASRHTQFASLNRLGDTRRTMEEQVRNAWDTLETASDNASYLKNQADISSEFLELARKDRKLGNRSLIDLLSGETDLINASSDAVSADTDVAIAVFTLLSVTGKLDTDIIK